MLKGSGNPLRPSEGHRRTGVNWGDERAQQPETAAENKALRRFRWLPGDWRKLLLGSLAPVLAMAASGFLVWQGLQHPPKMPERTERPPDPLAGYPGPLQRSLMSTEITVPASLKLVFSGDPKGLCAELATLGLVNSGWRPAPLIRGRWQCASDVVPLSTPSVDYGAATLFFLLRGPSENRIDYLRLKLNVEDPRQMAHGQDAVRSVVVALSERYGWAVPERFLKAIASFERLEMTDRGVRLSVSPEDPALTGDPSASQRLNIILNFGEPDLIRPADGFEPARK